METTICDFPKDTAKLITLKRSQNDLMNVTDSMLFLVLETTQVIMMSLAKVKPIEDQQGSLLETKKK